MKGYYIYFGDLSMNLHKKIGMQIKELSKYAQMEEICVKDKARSTPERVIRLLPFLSANRLDVEPALSQVKDADFVYIRRTNADAQYIAFLKAIREKNPGCKVIVEVYTYPYMRDEFYKWDAWPYYFKEVQASRHYKECIDRFVTYSADKELFGVKTLPTCNGIDTSLFQPVSPRTYDDEIHMLCVAMFQRHHGYERILRGMGEYYQAGGSRKVVLTMVGKGPEEEKYRSLVTEYQLEEHVSFVGLKSGDELNAIYDQADIALASFNGQVIGLSSVSTLKAKEYLAKGLPIITGIPDPIMMGQDLDFYHEVPNDQSTVPLQEIIDFYDREYGRENEKREDLIRRIRDYAVKNCSMEVALAPVVSFIQGKEA